MGTLGVGLYVLFRDVPASTASYAVFLESGMSQNITSLAGQRYENHKSLRVRVSSYNHIICHLLVQVTSTLYHWLVSVRVPYIIGWLVLEYPISLAGQRESTLYHWLVTNSSNVYHWLVYVRAPHIFGWLALEHPITGWIVLEYRILLAGSSNKYPIYHQLVSVRKPYIIGWLVQQHCIALTGQRQSTLYHWLVNGRALYIVSVRAPYSIGWLVLEFPISLEGQRQSTVYHNNKLTRLIPHALHSGVPSSASLHRGVRCVPQDAHTFP